jgi:hypothetical protein
MTRTVRLRHAWLQKHPTPTASSGDFHWHPNVDDEIDRGARLAIVERMRGVAPPAVLWRLAPGRVTWAQVFAATAPGDGRRYLGLVMTTAEADGASAADLLASLRVPAARPLEIAGDAVDRAGDSSRFASVALGGVRVANAIDEDERDAPVGAIERASSIDVPLEVMPAIALSSTRRAHRDSVLPDPAAVVRALITGGVAGVADPGRGDLPGWIASLEAWLPAAIRARARHGEWRAGGRVAHVDVDADAATAVVDAWCPPETTTPLRARRALQLAIELADARGCSIDEVVADAASWTDRETTGDLDRVLTRDERGALPATATSWLRVVHHWGRGALDRSPASASLPSRLGDLVALRVLADHMTGVPDLAALNEARWHALLPAARRRALLVAAVRRAPSLRELVDVELEVASA